MFSKSSDNKNKNDYPTNAGMTQTSLRKKAKGFFFLIEVQLICNVVPICGEQQSDQLQPYTHSFSIMVYPGRLDVVPCAEQQDLAVHPLYM